MGGLADVDADLIPVRPWVIWSAFRYGCGKSTPAHEQSINLILRHWDRLGNYHTVILDALDDASLSEDRDVSLPARVAVEVLTARGKVRLGVDYGDL